MVRSREPSRRKRKRKRAKEKRKREIAQSFYVIAAERDIHTYTAFKARRLFDKLFSTKITLTFFEHEDDDTTHDSLLFLPSPSPPPRTPTTTPTTPIVDARGDESKEGPQMGRRVSVGKEQSGEEIEVEISADSGIRSRARIRLDARIIRRRRLERLGKG